MDGLHDSKDASNSKEANNVSNNDVVDPNEGENITEEEFEALLDELHGFVKEQSGSQTNKEQSKAEVVEQTDNQPNNNDNKQENDEKEKETAVIEQPDNQPNNNDNKQENDERAEETVAEEETSKSNESVQEVSNDDEDITEEEFEALLDELAQKSSNNKKTEKTDNTKTSKPAENIISSQDKDSTISAVDSKQKVVKPDNAKEEQSLAQDKSTVVIETKTDLNTVENVKLAEKTPSLDTKKSNTEENDNAKKDVKNIKSNMETTVRVDTNRLDQIMNMVGEIVLVRNRLVKLKNYSTNEDIIKTVGMLDLVTADLQIAVMKTRMQPIKKVFGRFPRVVRDLARGLKKEIVLEMTGEDTDLDKNLVEALADPLVHLVRNSVDHGIELPEQREKIGKPRVGKILLSAAQEGDHIVLSIEDDGSGMDPEKLREKAIDKGLITREAANRLSETECVELIFIPGFSTKTEITDISGRGVGMDVVKTKIAQLNGSIDIFSELGKGNKINIKVPLTLAILPTLMIVVGEQPIDVVCNYSRRCSSHI